jgi:hypothetical protein
MLFLLLPLTGRSTIAKPWHKLSYNISLNMFKENPKNCVLLA